MKPNPHFPILLKGIEKNSDTLENLFNFFKENYPDTPEGRKKFDNHRHRYVLTVDDYDFGIDIHKQFKRESSTYDIGILNRGKESLLKNGRNSSTNRIIPPSTFYDLLKTDLLHNRSRSSGIRKKISEIIEKRTKPLYFTNPVEEGDFQINYTNLLEDRILKLYLSVVQTRDSLEQLKSFDFDLEIICLEEGVK